MTANPFGRTCSCRPASLTHYSTIQHRIVFGAVNQYMFRMFHQSDPALARLIRNIKETAGGMATCECASYKEILHLAPRKMDLLLDQPLFPEEILRAEYFSLSSRTFSLREHLQLSWMMVEWL